MKTLKLTLLMFLASMIFGACEKSHVDDEEETQNEAVYKIVIDAHIVTGKYYPEYSCDLYDINLVSSNGEVYSLGTVGGGRAKTFTLPSTHKNENILIMAFNLAKDESKAKDAYYLCPCMSDGTPYPILVVDFKTTVFSVNDDMVFRTYKYKTTDELKEFAKSIAEEMTGK